MHTQVLQYLCITNSLYISKSFIMFKIKSVSLSSRISFFGGRHVSLPQPLKLLATQDLTTKQARGHVLQNVGSFLQITDTFAGPLTRVEHQVICPSNPCNIICSGSLWGLFRVRREHNYQWPCTFVFVIGSLPY